VAEHQAIYDAIATKDSDAAEHAMVQHLAISKVLIMRAFNHEMET
jgi:DNA-binding FadR family transcriptional regulator